MSFAIKTILVPTDFSETAENALRLAIAIAERHSAAIHLLHVVAVQTVPPSMEKISNPLHEMAASMEESKKSIRDIKTAILKDHALTVSAVSEFGSVGVNIANYVSKCDIDLVVMGTHGKSGWKKFLMGSNAMAAIKACSCPVLTIPLTYKKSTFDEVVYPVRNIEGVVEKYEFVKAIIEKNNSVVHLLGVIPTDEAGEYELAVKLDNVKEIINKDVPTITAETQSCSNIADKIIEYANESNADLLVINATLDKGWKEYFTGSYTQQIINQSLIPVIAIKADSPQR